MQEGDVAPRSGDEIEIEKTFLAMVLILPQGAVVLSCTTLLCHWDKSVAHAAAYFWPL